MTDTGPTTPETPPPPPPGEIDQPADRTRLVVGAVLAIVIVAAIIGVVVLMGGDDSDEVADLPTTSEPATDPDGTTDETTATTEPDTTDPGATTAPDTTAPDTTGPDTTGPDTTEPDPTTTTVDETTTTVADTTTTEPPPPTEPTPQEAELIVWPFLESDLRYDEPAAAALGLAADLVGMFEPRVGEVMMGDARSAEVEVFSGTFAIPTIVSVRQLADDHWWVLGSASPNLLLDSPAAGDTVSSPIGLSGTSTASEATVLVDVVAVGASPADDRLHEGFFSGGGAMGDMAPFEALVELAPEAVPDQPTPIVLMLSTASQRDGGRSEATTVRLTLTP